ncbi:hypothetical protein TNCV_3346691 [Trichonephila clavipes]|nr:hypothetical protein TNCV_3346691 [Trichonephila clavipes]
MQRAENLHEPTNLKPMYVLNLFANESRTIAKRNISTKIQSHEAWGVGGYLNNQSRTIARQNIKYDEEDVVTWMACDSEDCGFQMLNDDEIVTSVHEELDPVDDEMDEDEDNNSNESS